MYIGDQGLGFEGEALLLLLLVLLPFLALGLLGVLVGIQRTMWEADRDGVLIHIAVFRAKLDVIGSLLASAFARHIINLILFNYLILVRNLQIFGNQLC